LFFIVLLLFHSFPFFSIFCFFATIFLLGNNEKVGFDAFLNERTVYTCVKVDLRISLNCHLRVNILSKNGNPHISGMAYSKYLGYSIFQYIF
jgi:hypothetical protein